MKIPRVLLCVMLAVAFIACDNGNEGSEGFVPDGGETARPVTAEALRGKTFYGTVTVTRSTSTGPIVFAPDADTCEIYQPVPVFDEEGNPDGYGPSWIECGYEISDGSAIITTQAEGMEELALTIQSLKADGSFDIEYPAELISPEAAENGIETLTLTYFQCANGFVGRVWDGEWLVEAEYTETRLDSDTGEWTPASGDISSGGWIELDFVTLDKVTINYETDGTYTVSGKTATITVPGKGSFSVTGNTIDIADDVFINIFNYHEDTETSKDFKMTKITAWVEGPSIAVRW